MRGSFLKARAKDNELFAVDPKDADLVELLAAFRYGPDDRKLELRAILLERLHAIDSSAINSFHPHDISQISRIVNVRDLEMTVAACSALQHIGDKSSLVKLDLIAESKPAHTIHPDIQRSASACAKAIRTRLSGNQGRDTLLRAAETPTETATLLHPVKERGLEPEQAQLLRPSNSNSD